MKEYKRFLLNRQLVHLDSRYPKEEITPNNICTPEVQRY